MSDTMNLVNAVEEVKEKLSSKEYKDILDNAMKIHNNSSNNNDRNGLDVHAGIHEVYVEALHTIMEEVGGYSMRGFLNAALPSRVPRLIELIVDDVREGEKQRKYLQAKQDWYECNIPGYVNTRDIIALIKDYKEEEDDTQHRALFYLYLYRYEELDEDECEELDKLFEFDLDEEDPDPDEWYYHGWNDYDNYESYTIDEVWDMMMKGKTQHYLIYDFLEEISVY